MSFAILPVELLDSIVDHLHATRDLLAFSSTSSLVRTVAHRALYRHLCIMANPTSIKVLDVLEHNPHLARHVRSFAFVVPDSYTTSPPSYMSLSTALAHMRDLESLKLTIDPAMSWVLPDASELRFPRLRDFTCVFSLDHHVVEFLGKTNALLHLELGHDKSNASLPDLSSSSIPLLSSFAGSSQAAQAIVPARPVSFISMHSGDLTEDVVHTLAKSTAAVTFLDATTASLPLPLLEAMANDMPDLQQLRLATTYNLWDEWFNTPFIANIKDVFMNMNKLYSAEVSGMLWRWLEKDRRVLANEPKVLTDEDDHSDADASSYFHA